MCTACDDQSLLRFAQELIEIEETGKLSKHQKLHKKVLQDNYEQALQKKKVCRRRCTML